MIAHVRPDVQRGACDGHQFMARPASNSQPPPREPRRDQVRGRIHVATRGRRGTGRPARASPPSPNDPGENPRPRRSLLEGQGLLVFALTLFDYRSADAPAEPSAGTTAVVTDAVHNGDVYLPEVKGEEKAVLTTAPEMPPQITRAYATHMIVDLKVVETTAELADGVDYNIWTFGGTVPGSFVRVREGDIVEFNLLNHPDNVFPHNIDLHAVTGTGDGAEASLIVPGKQAKFEFRAIKPGLYVYHCATAPVGMHIANGTYGLILVEPKEGLPEVDEEFYVMQSEFYTTGAFKEEGFQDFSMEKAVKEEPDYVVFNGRVGAMTGAGALEAEAGETVRLFVGNGGPNLSSSFHVIGEMFDTVYGEGGTLANQQNVQTTVVPPGGSTIVQFKVDVPGTYTLVDHAIFRAFNKGAIGIMKVSGEETPNIFAEEAELKDYRPGTSLRGTN